MKDCFACDLTNGKEELPGGAIHTSGHWVVEHCVAPFGVGTLVVKPLRHCVHVWELTDDESRELGPLLRLVSAAIERILHPEQIYVCLWSHSGWQPVHIHFVLQPVPHDAKRLSDRPGFHLQVAMSEKGVPTPRDDVQRFCDRVREVIGSIADAGPGENRDA